MARLPHEIDRILAGFVNNDLLPLAESVYNGADPSVRNRVLTQTALILNTNAPNYLKAFTLMKLVDHLENQRLFSSEAATAIHTALAELLNNRLPKEAAKPAVDRRFQEQLSRIAIRPDNIEAIKKEITQLIDRRWQKPLLEAKSLEDLTNKLIEVGTISGSDYLAVLGHTLTVANEPPLDFLVWGMDVNDERLKRELQTTKQLLGRSALRSEKLRSS